MLRGVSLVLSHVDNKWRDDAPHKEDQLLLGLDALAYNLDLIVRAPFSTSATYMVHCVNCCVAVLLALLHHSAVDANYVPSRSDPTHHTRLHTIALVHLACKLNRGGAV